MSVSFLYNYKVVNNHFYQMAELEREKYRVAFHLPHVHRPYGGSGFWIGKCSVSASSPLDKWQSLETQKREEW